MRKELFGGRHTCRLYKRRLHFGHRLQGERKTDMRGFIKQPEKVSKTDSYTDKSRKLKVFTF